MRIKHFILNGGQSLSKELMISKIQAKTKSPKLSELAGLYWELLVETDYLKEISYLHLVKGLTYKEIEDTTEYKWDNIRNTIYRDKIRLERDITTDIYDYILSDETTNKMTDMLITIVQELVKTSERRIESENLFDQLNINLDPYVYNRENDMEDVEFIKTVEKLNTFSNEYNERLLGNLPEELVGYIKYLLGTDPKYLNNKDIGRREQLIQSWWLNE